MSNWKSPKLAKVMLVKDRTAESNLQEGYLRLHRWTLRNIYDNGSESKDYGCDVVDRAGLDAVAVVLYAIEPKNRTIRVLLRECLRPGLMLRANHALPLPELRERPVTWEIVAGVIEPGERGQSAINERAAAEVREEAGFEIYGPAVTDLGAGILPSPGPFPEKIYLKAVEVDPADQGRPVGDGSPMEQGSSLRWFDLAVAIQMCVNGQIEDAKTEIALRRLAQRLGYLADVGIWTDQIGRAT
jgi:ADP-ribose pyrophosphatase